MGHRCSGQIVKIISLKNDRSYNVRTVNVPEGSTKGRSYNLRTTKGRTYTTLDKAYVDLHRGDSLNLTVEEKKAIEDIEENAKQRTSRVI